MKLVKVTRLSRGTAVVLLCLYVVYMVFQLRTRKDLFVSVRPESDVHGDARETAALSSWAALTVLVITTVVVSICADALV